MKLEIGKTYTIDHSRKGRFTGTVESDTGESAVVTVTSTGGVNGLTTTWHPGDEMVVRKSLATFDGERAE